MKTDDLKRRVLWVATLSMMAASMALSACSSTPTDAEIDQYASTTGLSITPATAAEAGALAIGSTRTMVVKNQNGTAINPSDIAWAMQVLNGIGAVATLTGPNLVCVSAGSVKISATLTHDGKVVVGATNVDCAARTLRISSEPTNKQLLLSEGFEYKAEVREPNNTLTPGTQTYTWTSSDPSVAEFRQPGSGAITIQRFGKVTITVKSAQVPQAVTTELTIPVPIQKLISVPRGPATDPANSLVPLAFVLTSPPTRQYRIEDEHGALSSIAKWISSDPGVADIISVDFAAIGIARCKAGGTTTIMGIDLQDTNNPSTTTLTCISLTVSPRIPTLRVGDTDTLTATVTGATAPVDVNWSSLSTANVVVTKLTATTASVVGMKITAPGPSTLITATYVQSGVTVTGESNVTVVAPPPPPSFVVSPDLLPLAVGEAKPLTTVMQNVVGTPVVTWQSRDPLFASVSPSSGVGTTVTASNKLFRDAFTHVVATMTAGTVTLRDSALVLVPAAQVDISPKLPTVAAGASQAFTLFTVDVNGVNTGTIPNTEITWSTSSPLVTFPLGDGVARCSPTATFGASYRITGTVNVVAGANARTAETSINCQAAAPVPGYSVAPGIASVVQAAPATLVTMPITRVGGFTNTIGVSTTYTPPGNTIPGPLPTGLVVTPTSATGFSGNTITFNVSASTAVPPGTYVITVNLSSSVTAPPTTLTITVAAATVSNAVVRVVLEALSAELTPLDFNASQANAFRFVVHLFNAAGVEVPAETNGVVSFTGFAQNVLIVNGRVPTAVGQPAFGAVFPSAAGSTSVTAVYTLNGATILSVPSPVTVYAAGTPGYSSNVGVQLPVGSSEYPAAMREVKVGTTVPFDLVIRDQNGATAPFNANQHITFMRSSNATISAPVQVSNLRYSFTVSALPATSVVPGLANVVWLQVDVEGAMTRIPIRIVP